MLNTLKGSNDDVDFVGLTFDQPTCAPNPGAGGGMVFELLGHLAGHGGAANLRGGVGAVGTHGTHALNLVGSGNEVHDRCYCPNSETRNHGSGLVRRRPGAAACGGWARERSSGARCSWSEMGVARGAGCTAAGGGSWIGLVCALSIILSLQSIPLTPHPPPATQRHWARRIGRGSRDGCLEQGLHLVIRHCRPPPPPNLSTSSHHRGSPSTTKQSPLPLPPHSVHAHTIPSCPHSSVAHLTRLRTRPPALQRISVFEEARRSSSLLCVACKNATAGRPSSYVDVHLKTTNLVSPGSFPLQGRRLRTAHLTCQLDDSRSTRVRHS